jgi:transposase
MNTSTLEPALRRTRRRHSPEFRASIVAACSQPAVSVAAIALANGLNANLVRRWVQEAGHHSRGGARSAQADGAAVRPPRAAPAATGGCAPAAGFIPLPLAAASPSGSPGAAPAAADICVELQRGALHLKIVWPLGASADCLQWLRELAP